MPHEHRIDVIEPGARRERVELILQQIDRLPTLPQVAARLLAVTSSEDSCLKDVVEIAGADASITAAILHLVRRADLGAPQDRMDISKAIGLLGFRAVRNLVLTVRVFDALSGREEANRKDHRTGLWVHNLAVACAAELLAECARERFSSSDAFLGGLLHDVGKIALDACMPKSYARAMELAERQRGCVCDVEQELFGMDHTVAGKRLVSRWRLGTSIVDVVWLHHQEPTALPLSGRRAELVQLVHLADAIVRQQGWGTSGTFTFDDLPALAGGVGLSSKDLDAVIERIPRRLEPLCECLGLRGGAKPELTVETLVAANRTLGDVNRELTCENSRLSAGAGYLAALRQASADPLPSERLHETCLRIARIVGELVTVEAVVGIAVDVSRGIAFGAPSSAVRFADAEPTILEVDASEEVQRFQQNLGARPTELIIAPGQASDDLWQAVTRSNPDSPIWTFVYCRGEQLLGAVLLAAEKPRIALLCSSSSPHAEALAAGLSLVLTSAYARLEAERSAEELVDLNRRLSAAQREALRAKSISMIAKMAGGAAHELNNPLSVIAGRAQLALGATSDPDLRRSFEIIDEQAKKAAGIVTDLMSFARPDPPAPTAASLSEVLEPLCQHYRQVHSLGQHQLRVEPSDAGEATVYADINHVREAIGALLTNAVEAAGADRVEIVINSPPSASDDQMRLEITDNGPGMTRDVREHAFDPFFSSRLAGRGRGLGLSRAYRLIEINGGKLWLESTPQQGTTVFIELPARAPAK